MSDCQTSGQSVLAVSNVATKLSGSVYQLSYPYERLESGVEIITAVRSVNADIRIPQHTLIRLLKQNLSLFSS